LTVPPQGSDSEVRLNCATFAFVVTSDLWRIEGRYDREKAFAAGRVGPVNFPVEAMAVKARWRKLRTPEDDENRFHVGTDAQGQKWVLLGLHLTSKLLPNWIWATWEHVDNRERRKRGDHFGFVDEAANASPQLLRLLRENRLGDEWLNYRLNGTQIDFADSAGVETLLGNSTMEGAFLGSSSCITCHSRAARDVGDYDMPLFEKVGLNPNNPPKGYVGPPQKQWFGVVGNGRPTFMQFDFLYTMSLRPQSHSHPPPMSPPDCAKIEADY
jgi:hypothetical protein